MSDPIIAALQALLTTDPQFVADMQALGLGQNGQPVTPGVLLSNRRFDQLGQEHYPCWVIDAGEGSGEDGGNDGTATGGLAIGSCHQHWAFDYALAFCWINQDFAAALSQRQGVFRALVRLLLRNPSMADTANLAYIAQADNDLNQKHPTHFSSYVVRTHQTIQRDA